MGNFYDSILCHEPAVPDTLPFEQIRHPANMLSGCPAGTTSCQPQAKMREVGGRLAAAAKIAAIIWRRKIGTHTHFSASPKASAKPPCRYLWAASTAALFVCEGGVGKGRDGWGFCAKNMPKKQHLRVFGNSLKRLLCLYCRTRLRSGRGLCTCLTFHAILIPGYGSKTPVIKTAHSLLVRYWRRSRAAGNKYKHIRWRTQCSSTRP
jgi:hypothetical protein